MKTIIYPDYETDLGIYEKLDSEILVYDENGTINTNFEKINTLDMFSQVDAIIFTQNLSLIHI